MHIPLSLNSLYCVSYLAILLMKGCFNASAGVHRFSGFKAKQRSRRSAKRLSSFISTSVIPLEAPNNLVRRSRVGLARVKVLIVSLPVNLSCSTLIRLAISSKWICANCARRSIFTVNLPRHSIIERSIWLLERPVKRILPV